MCTTCLRARTWHSQRKAPTKRQKQVLELLRAGWARGLPPTLREIGDAMGISSTNGVNDHLRALERKGYIERAMPGRSRGAWRPVEVAPVGTQKVVGLDAAIHEALALINFSGQEEHDLGVWLRDKLVELGLVQWDLEHGELGGGVMSAEPALTDKGEALLRERKDRGNGNEERQDMGSVAPPRRSDSRW